jgi:hypothetical protein
MFIVVSVSFPRYGKRDAILNFVRVFLDLEDAKVFARSELRSGHYSQCTHRVFIRRSEGSEGIEDSDDEDIDDEDIPFEQTTEED